MYFVRLHKARQGKQVRVEAPHDVTLEDFKEEIALCTPFFSRVDFSVFHNSVEMTNVSQRSAWASMEH